MDDWGGATGDQYTVDMESRFPVFSDMQLSDYSIQPNTHKPRRMVMSAQPAQYHDPALNGLGSYETLFRDEMMGVPSVMTCRCSKCVPNPLVRNIAKAAPMPTQLEIKIDTTVLVFLFMFVVIVFICCYYGRALTELKAQLKVLQHMVKK